MAHQNETSFLELSPLDLSLANYPLLKSPTQPIGIVLFYLLFIFNLGPKFMKNRSPYDLRKVIVVYNAVQIVSNAVVFLMLLRLVPNFSMCCSLPNKSDTPLDVSTTKLHYYYMLLKYLDLLDTVFFVLRKKNNQITLLHVHHHTGMALTIWATLKYVPGGVLFYVFLWNTLVHAAMYIYYLLTSWGAARAVWWKKHLTQLQLVQHFFMFSVFLTHLVNSNCAYSKGWLVYYLFNTVLTIFLFLKFYAKQYKKAVMKCT